jgi:hypothetical protein
MLINEFDPIIYPFKLWIIVSNNPKVIEEKFNDINNNKIEYIANKTRNCKAFSMPVKGKRSGRSGAVIFFYSKKDITYKTAAHESSHVAKYLFEFIGASTKEHEPFEYLVGWMAECCERAKHNKPHD